ncbi:unnamed protein product [Prorocentrum cordatum]|uniref:Uncharacterized protein n=1 Tax=Prorocentrum cordatum TaxID=2364126 RepID=A0ABN9P607_9DINO|nr:unnamed protein product [Polarella glacialis]
MKELFVDAAIFVACQVFFRATDCTNASNCAIPWVLPAARVFFVCFNVLLLGSQLLLSRRARQIGGADAIEDAEYMEKRFQKFFVKALVLYSVHSYFGLMAPLVCSCLITAYGLPFFQDREHSCWAKYGRSKP